LIIDDRESVPDTWEMIEIKTFAGVVR